MGLSVAAERAIGGAGDRQTPSVFLSVWKAVPLVYSVDCETPLVACHAEVPSPPPTTAAVDVGYPVLRSLSLSRWATGGLFCSSPEPPFPSRPGGGGIVGGLDFPIGL